MLLARHLSILIGPGRIERSRPVPIPAKTNKPSPSPPWPMAPAAGFAGASSPPAGTASAPSPTTSSITPSPTSPSRKLPAPPPSPPASATSGAPTRSSSRIKASPSPSATPRVLADHPGRFRSVILYDCRLASLNRVLPGWPRLLVDRRTEKLLLAYSWVLDQSNPARLLPADILRCGSLQELSLDCWTFSADLSRCADIFLPQLQILTLTRIVVSDRDLECLIAACPVLNSLRLTINSPKHVRVRSKSLRCALVGLSKVEEFTVVDTPLLQRLYLFQQFHGGAVRIACVPNLRVLGYLDTRTHKLQVGDSVIRPDTMASSRTVVPSVEILALVVNLGISGEVKILASFLRCFPNVETLHIESAPHNPPVTSSEPSGEHHARFYQEVSQVDCLRAHAKEMVIHDFRGDQNEFEFVKFIAKNAQELQFFLVVVSDEGILSSADKVKEIKDELQRVQFCTGTSAVLRELPKAAILYRLKRAADLAVNDPFKC